jgi:hypothetical protein
MEKAVVCSDQPTESYAGNLRLTASQVVSNRAGGLRLRWLPSQLVQLQRLLDEHNFWAQGRSTADLRRMLAGS